MHSEIQRKENVAKPVENKSVNGEVNVTSKRRKSGEYAQILDGFHMIDVAFGRNP